MGGVVGAALLAAAAWAFVFRRRQGRWPLRKHHSYSKDAEGGGPSHNGWGSQSAGKSCSAAAWPQALSMQKSWLRRLAGIGTKICTCSSFHHEIFVCSRPQRGCSRAQQTIGDMLHGLCRGREPHFAHHQVWVSGGLHVLGGHRHGVQRCRHQAHQEDAESGAQLASSCCYTACRTPWPGACLSMLQMRQMWVPPASSIGSMT